MHRMKKFALVCAALVVWWINPAPAAVSGKHALETQLPSVNLTNVSVSDAIDFLRDVSGANIHVNWRALEEVGVGKDTQVNVRLRHPCPCEKCSTLSSAKPAPARH